MSNEGMPLVALLALPLLAIGAAVVVVGGGVVLTAKGCIWVGKKLHEAVNDWLNERERLQIEQQAELYRESQERERIEREKAESEYKKQLDRIEENKRREYQQLVEEQALKQKQEEENQRVRAERQQAWKRELQRVTEENRRREQIQKQAESERMRIKAELESQLKKAQAEEHQRILLELAELDTKKLTSQLSRGDDLNQWTHERQKQAEIEYANFLQLQLKDAKNQLETFSPSVVSKNKMESFLSLAAKSQQAVNQQDAVLAIELGQQALAYFDQWIPSLQTLQFERIRQQLESERLQNQIELALSSLENRLGRVSKDDIDEAQEDYLQIEKRFTNLDEKVSIETLQGLLEETMLAVRRLDKTVEQGNSQRKKSLQLLASSIAITDLLEYDQVLSYFVKQADLTAYERIKSLQKQVDKEINRRAYQTALRNAQTALSEAESLKNKAILLLQMKQIKALADLSQTTLEKMGYQVSASQISQLSTRISGWRGEHNFEIMVTPDGIAYNLDGFQGSACLNETEAFFQALKQNGIEFDPEEITPVYRGPRGGAQELAKWVQRILTENLGARVTETRTGMMGTETIAQLPDLEGESED